MKKFFGLDKSEKDKSSTNNILVSISGSRQDDLPRAPRHEPAEQKVVTVETSNPVNSKPYLFLALIPPMEPAQTDQMIVDVIVQTINAQKQGIDFFPSINNVSGYNYYDGKAQSVVIALPADFKLKFVKIYGEKDANYHILDEIKPEYIVGYLKEGNIRLLNKPTSNIYYLNSRGQYHHNPQVTSSALSAKTVYDHAISYDVTKFSRIKETLFDKLVKNYNSSINPVSNDEIENKLSSSNDIPANDIIESGVQKLDAAIQSLFIRTSTIKAFKKSDAIKKLIETAVEIKFDGDDFSSKEGRENALNILYHKKHYATGILSHQIKIDEDRTQFTITLVNLPTLILTFAVSDLDYVINQLELFQQSQNFQISTNNQSTHNSELLTAEHSSIVQSQSQLASNSANAVSTEDEIENKLSLLNELYSQLFTSGRNFIYNESFKDMIQKATGVKIRDMDYSSPDKRQAASEALHKYRIFVSGQRSFAIKTNEDKTQFTIIAQNYPPTFELAFAISSLDYAIGQLLDIQQLLDSNRSSRQHETPRISQSQNTSDMPPAHSSFWQPVVPANNQEKQQLAKADWPEWLNVFPADLKGYAIDCWRVRLDEINEENFEVYLSQHPLTANPTCSITHSFPKIPVMLNGNLYCLESLNKLPKMEDPINRSKFTWAEVTPNREAVKQLEAIKTQFPVQNVVQEINFIT